MIPLLAAPSAVGAAGGIALSAWQDMTSSKIGTSGPSANADAPGTDSFRAMLAAQGVDPGTAENPSTAPSATMGADTNRPHHGPHGAGRHVDTLA